MPVAPLRSPLFYNDRGECENRIEEFKNGFRADRLSCYRFLANAFRLLLHDAAFNVVNFFHHQLPSPWRSAEIEIRLDQEQFVGNQFCDVGSSCFAPPDTQVAAGFNEVVETSNKVLVDLVKLPRM